MSDKPASDMTSPRFKVGDRVRLKNDALMRDVGTIAEVGTTVTPDGRRYRIDFDDGVGNTYWFLDARIVALDDVVRSDHQEGEE